MIYATNATAFNPSLIYVEPLEALEGLTAAVVMSLKSCYVMAGSARKAADQLYERAKPRR